VKLGTPGPQEIFRKPILLRRQMFFFFLLSGFFLGFLECSAFFIFWFVHGKPFSYAQLHAEQEFIATGQIVTLEPRQNPTLPLAIHPYLGYVYTTAVNSEDFKKFHRHSVNKFGFIDSHTSIQQRANDQIIVGITGGSVAYWLSALADDILIAELL